MQPTSHGSAEYATGALNWPVESSGRPPALSPPALPDSSDMMKAKTQCYILPLIIEGLILQKKITVPNTSQSYVIYQTILYKHNVVT